MNTGRCSTAEGLEGNDFNQGLDPGAANPGELWDAGPITSNPGVPFSSCFSQSIVMKRNYFRAMKTAAEAKNGQRCCLAAASGRRGLFSESQGIFKMMGPRSAIRLKTQIQRGLQGKQQQNATNRSRSATKGQEQSYEIYGYTKMTRKENKLLVGIGGDTPIFNFCAR